MYRKDADRLIVRDVKRRLTDMRSEVPWADWRLAVTVSQSVHPDWYRHHTMFASVELLLRAGGVDMTEAEPPFHFVGNAGPDGG
jgi:hypothetical protein